MLTKLERKNYRTWWHTCNKTALKMTNTWPHML